MGVGVGTGEGALHLTGSRGRACVTLGSDQRLVCCRGREQRGCEVCKTEQGGCLETSQPSPVGCGPSSQGKVLFTNYTFSIKSSLFVLMDHGRQCPLGPLGVGVCNPFCHFSAVVMSKPDTSCESTTTAWSW